LLPRIVGRSNLSPTFCTMLLGFIQAFIPKYQSLQCTVKNINNCQCVRAHQGNPQNRLKMLNTNEPFFRGLFCDKEFQIFYKCKRYSIFVRCVKKNIFFLCILQRSFTKMSLLGINLWLVEKEVSKFTPNSI